MYKIEKKSYSICIDNIVNVDGAAYDTVIC